MLQLFDDLLDRTIKRLKGFEPSNGFYFADSGGKDSCVCREILKMAGVKYDAHYSVTTIDPPELVQFIRQNHKETKFEIPKIPLLKMLINKGFPLRQSRWCCEEYKENNGYGRFVLTGIRASESPHRRKRKMVETCYTMPNKRFIHPIIDWDNSDVWQFIKNNNIPYCRLYDEGFNRIGCVLCPMQTYHNKLRDIKRFPRMVENFRKAFNKLYILRKEQENPSVDRWESSDEMFEWWIKNDRKAKPVEGQILFT